METVKTLQTLRTGLWHLRKGGVQQLRSWRLRHGAAARNGDPAVARSLTDDMPVWPVADRPTRRPGGPTSSPARAARSRARRC